MAEEIIELNITGLSSTGDGLGRHYGMAIFVAGALPGETVRARFRQVKKNYAKAELKEIVYASAERVAPICPLYAACGGCTLQHYAYSAQLRWKRQWLVDALQRIGGLAVGVNHIIGAKQTTDYRNRVQLHCSWRNGALKLGFYRRGSRELTEAASCLVMHPVLRQIARLLAEALPGQAERLAGLRHIALRCDSYGERAMLTFVGLEGQNGYSKLAEGLMERAPSLVSVWANWGKTVYGVYGDKWRRLAGLASLPDSLLQAKLQISPGVFTQINATQARLLYERVAHYAHLSGAETVLDAYSGIGVIALYLAAQAKAVIGLEEYAPAVADARQNIRLNGISNCRFLAGRVENTLPRLAAEGQKIEAVVLDPPRAGCAAAALKALARLSPKRIVYVSCDPATLARDARLLVELGYTFCEAQPLDMFPHTEHVEAVAVFVAES